MVRPENCSLEIYNLLECCWTDDPLKRPSFKHLATKFEKLLGKTAKYLEVEEISISNPTYIGDDMGEFSINLFNFYLIQFSN